MYQSLKTMQTILRSLVLLNSCLLMPLGALTSAQEKAPQQVKQELRRVENKKVCMVNDMVFERDQIPVQVGQKTYYGCCAMCKERLGNDASAREALDPVSGKKVDKASAVIGARPDGSVTYFENEANFTKFSKGQ